ncbi:3879_t:CDS:2 [Gigaspora margarita]|uniref:3879_t:CDS:1 n=1 Tax=Gigaspora margarita TaxID=4874 RepID=A0ABM8W0I4_GIGMA|nr:3879_t:CDS:2 [Gigaspora margarita]
MSANQKTPENEYKNLKDSKFKYDAKFYLAKQYENGLGLSKNYSDFKDDKRTFEFYSHLYTSIPKYKSFARNSLIKCYKLGIGVEMDEEQAYKLENEALRYDRR